MTEMITAGSLSHKYTLARVLTYFIH